MKKLLIGCLILLVSTTSCYDNKDICFQRPQTPLTIQFLNARGEANAPRGQVKLSLPEFPRDTSINVAASHSIILNPVDSRILMVFGNRNIRDSLTIPYQTKMTFFSEACGFVPTFSIQADQITHVPKPDTSLIKEILVNYSQIEINAKNQAAISLYHSLPTVAQ